MIPTTKNIENRLRVKQLALIASLAQLKTLHKVAEAMHLSQPAVTKMLHEMEVTLGVPLFERSPRGMVPTTYGESVIEYAISTLTNLDNLRKRLITQSSGGEGEISVGSIMAPSAGLLAHTVVDVKARYPRLKIRVQIETSDILVSLLREGKIDIVLGRLAGSESDEFNFEVLEDEPLSVICSTNHPLLASRRLTLRHLADLPWILQPPSSPMRQVLERAFRDEGLMTPQNLIETASILTTTTLLQETDMVAVTPTTIAKQYASAGLIGILPVRIKFQLEPYGIITRKDDFPTPAISIFQTSLRQRALA
ncbi:LysR family transcriptional regulator [Noviherbaspirillum saxi]|uniref:LysR family transcriptional regulator n=1 Tax=Noviherbaspirillum saxi TaxID=2320863 RepID=A0A3A3FQ78_9BURK|nr:LysR family transcriptional regulator [Noviherbaspirillum saxi]RJF95859.1 LysR family transcriptional regulator [Noviherbaspirillum saxi]